MTILIITNKRSSCADYRQRTTVGAVAGNMELRKIGFALLRQDNGLQTTDNGRGGSRKYGTTENWLCFATPRLQTTDNGRGGNRLYGTTELWNHGMGEVSRAHCSRLVDCESAVG